MTGCGCSASDSCIDPACKCQTTGVCTCGPKCGCASNKK